MVKLKVCLSLLTLLGLALSLRDYSSKRLFTDSLMNQICGFLMIMVVTYFLIEKFSIKFSTGQKNVYAKQISAQQFHKQSIYYTNYQLLELYNSKEYIKFEQNKKVLPCMPYEKIIFSDEEGFCE
jgi:hypothetical protein